MKKTILLICLFFVGYFVNAQQLTCSTLQSVLTAVENGTIESYRKENVKQNYYHSSLTMGANKSPMFFNENASGKYIFSQVSESAADFDAVAKEFLTCMNTIRTQSLLIDVIDTVNRKEYMPSDAKSPIKRVVLSLSAKGATSIYVYFKAQASTSTGATKRSNQRLVEQQAFSFMMNTRQASALATSPTQSYMTVAESSTR